MVVVGAGLAGLACAQDLGRAGVGCLVLEASDGVGGRVRTDAVDGYLLDRGFQILLTAYPEVRRRLDLAALDLAHLRARGGGAGRRRPSTGWPTPCAGRCCSAPPWPPRSGTLADKVRLARLVLDVRTHPVRRAAPPPGRPRPRPAWPRPASPGHGRLVLAAAVRRHPAGSRPRGVQPTLRRHPAHAGRRAPPGCRRRGMGAVPAQLAAALPAGTVRLGTRSTGGRPVGGGAGRRASGSRPGRWWWRRTGPTAHRLLGRRVPDPGSRAAACCWFAMPAGRPVAGADPDAGRRGQRSGEERGRDERGGPVLRAGRVGAWWPRPCPAPRPSTRPSATGCRRQLARWFGSTAAEWDHLRTDVIPHGQPAQAPPFRPEAAGGAR